MIMNEQVLSVEQMQHLIKLGIDVSSASMKFISTHPSCDYSEDDEIEFIPVCVNFYAKQHNESGKTFTLQDMLALMPKQIDDYTLNWYISEMIFRYDKIDLFGKFEVLEDLSFYFNENVTILNVAYGMLCKLAECGYLNNKH